MLTHNGKAPIKGKLPGPALLADPDSTAFIPRGWSARVTPSGGIILDRDLLV